ncbi:hypothetical protein FEM48_Zijuj10G0066400 [Ziziphus jujuba var. spinosa]|uniref:Cytochrome P450 CYP749A22-like n=1 Tax=Ziziphus jujuba var. spinosa TaxID=714518 RepID=A0A978ULW4_ZIZJJ|nr:hypothetical protein FEM48_Zijuj10G0066400 [Ziziphus jujuba var. spinosa]
MGSQGIKGLSYRFIHGSTENISRMRNESMATTMGKVYLQCYGSQAQLVVTEQELIKEILNNKDGPFPKNDKQGFVKKLVGDGLLTTKGEKWAKMRKLANYAFHGGSLKGMILAMISSVEMMLERKAFGSSYQKGKDIFEMLRRLALLTSKNTYKLRFPILSCIIEMIKEREEKVTSGEEDSFGGDFLGLLLKAHHDANNSHKISVDDLVDECKTFYFVGQETTNTLLAWTVFLLAIHIDWQEEVRKEVLNLFGHENPNPEGIAKLKTDSGPIFINNLFMATENFGQPAIPDFDGIAEPVAGIVWIDAQEAELEAQKLFGIRGYKAKRVRLQALVLNSRTYE